MSTILIEAVLHGKPVAAYTPTGADASEQLTSSLPMLHFSDFLALPDVLQPRTLEELLDAVAALADPVAGPARGARLAAAADHFVAPFDRPWRERIVAFLAHAAGKPPCRELRRFRHCGPTHDLAGKSIAVTGGAGLIGSFLVERLVAAGARVVVADDFSKGRAAYLTNVRSKIEIREGDLESLDAMARALDGAEVVFHLASRAYGVGYSAGRHLADSRAQRAHHQQPARTCWRAGRSRICWSPPPPASIRTTAPTRCPSCRSSPVSPRLANWGYGWAKRILEQKALDAGARDRYAAYHRAPVQHLR